MLAFTVKFILWILMIYGINQIITQSSLFKDFREFTSHKFIKKIVNCFLCNSVWVSFLISFTIWSPSMIAFGSEFTHGVIYTTFKSFWEYDEGWLNTLFPIYWGIISVICSFLDAMLASTVIWFLHLIEKVIAVNTIPKQYQGIIDVNKLNKKG